MELSKYPKMENVRTFHIQAIQIPIVYNRYGDYDPDGLLYVLDEDAERIRREALKLYRSGSFAWDVESGMWGIFRVVKRTFGHRCKGIYRKIRDCFR